ncbi:hypothetical protein B1H10_05960 [candidate division KSB1 bacterium 4484_188]|nr:MAG: hypothetical protein B1H10_05960 [candidate division KSB1 bacterium 4484_188]
MVDFLLRNQHGGLECELIAQNIFRGLYQFVDHKVLYANRQKIYLKNREQNSDSQSISEDTEILC